MVKKGGGLWCLNPLTHNKNTSPASGAARAHDQKTPERTQKEEEGPTNRTLQISPQDVERVVMGVCLA